MMLSVSNARLMKLPVLALAAALVLSANSANAAWNLLDDFENLSAGTTVTGTSGAGANWDGGAPHTAQADPDDAGNTALRILADDTGQVLRAQFSNASTNIDSGAEGTLYYRFRTGTAANGTSDTVVGLLDNPAEAGFSFKSGLRNTLAGGTNLDARNGSPPDPSYESVSTLLEDTWYSLWMVSDNVAADPPGGTFELYLKSDSDPTYATQTQLASVTGNVFKYRVNGPTDIIAMYFRTGNGGAGTAEMYYDDIWINNDTADLTVPVPEPTALVLLASGLGMLLGRRR